MERYIRRSAAAMCACLTLCWAVPGGAENAAPAQEAAAETAQETAAPAETAAYSVLSSGSKGEEVRRLQERLTELGYEPGAADGIYGSGTKKAVRAFQKANGLKTDGTAGPQTQAALYSQAAVRAAEKPAPVDVLASELPMLVNKEHPVGENFEPADLVSLNEVCDPGLVKIKYKNTRAVRQAAVALTEMLEAAREDGVTKWQVSAAYRSYESQENILNARISTYLKRNSGWSRKKARSAALRTVAEPGASEHHLGLAIDINVPGASSFLGTKQCSWLHEHCWDYGFIVRYQEGKESITGFTAEAWHIRYIGAEHARVMRDRGLCLEEYLQGIAEGSIEMPRPEVTEEVLLGD